MKIYFWKGGLIAISEQQNPQLDNQVELNNMSDIGFINAYLFEENMSEDELKRYIQYPMIYNRQIRHVSKRMYNLNGMYAQTVMKMVPRHFGYNYCPV